MCWCFGHEWGDSPTIIASNVLLSENHGQITSHVTTKIVIHGFLQAYTV